MSRGRVLITGASTGIGAALAMEFAQNDFDLIITARRESALNAVRQSILDEVGSEIDVTVQSADLMAPDGASELIARVSESGLDIDILVNNAGVAVSGEFTEIDEAEIENLLMLNIVSLTRLTRHFIAPMRRRGNGRILNVASVAAFQPIPSMAVYAASKSYVLSLSESLSEELRGSGVSVTALCPGLTKTEMVTAQKGDSVPDFLMSSVQDVARDGFAAVMAREVIRIPGVANQAAVTWAHFQPRWLIRGLGGLASRLNPANATKR